MYVTFHSRLLLSLITINVPKWNSLFSVLWLANVKCNTLQNSSGTTGAQSNTACEPTQAGHSNNHKTMDERPRTNLILIPRGPGDLQSTTQAGHRHRGARESLLERKSLLAREQELRLAVLACISRVQTDIVFYCALIFPNSRA